MSRIAYKDIPQIPESAYAGEMHEILAELQATTKASYEKEKQQRAVRSAHAKSYGIVRASFEIPTGLPREHAQGIYATPATYEALIRFSNGLGHLGPDAALRPSSAWASSSLAFPGIPYCMTRRRSGISISP